MNTSDSTPRSDAAAVSDDSADAEPAARSDGVDAVDRIGAPGSPDATLGGYLRTHDRPPAFEGLDGHPYTVSVEVEKTADLRAPWAGYLVFPRWARTGLGIVGHLETATLWRDSDRDAVVAAAEATSLVQLQAWLDEAVARRASDPDPDR